MLIITLITVSTVITCITVISVITYITVITCITVITVITCITVITNVLLIIIHEYLYMYQFIQAYKQRIQLSKKCKLSRGDSDPRIGVLQHPSYIRLFLSPSCLSENCALVRIALYEARI